MASNGTPCAGELRFWDVVPRSIHQLAADVHRIADALEARNKHDRIGEPLDK